MRHYTHKGRSRKMQVFLQKIFHAQEIRPVHNTLRRFMNSSVSPGSANKEYVLLL